MCLVMASSEPSSPERERERESGFRSMSESEIYWPSGRRGTIFLPSALEGDEEGQESTLVGRGVERVSGAGSVSAATAAQTMFLSSGRGTALRHAMGRATERLI